MPVYTVYTDEIHDQQLSEIIERRKFSGPRKEMLRVLLYERMEQVLGVKNAEKGEKA